MKYDVMIGNEKLSVAAETEIGSEQLAILQKYLESYSDLFEEYEIKKYEMETAKLQMEHMAEKLSNESGFKSLDARYYHLTYVKGSEGRTESVKVLDTGKMMRLLTEFGYDPEDFYTFEERTIGARKDSVRFKTK